MCSDLRNILKSKMGDYEEEEDIKYGPPGSRKDEYKALPKFNEEKPMIGPKIDGQIKVVYKSFIEGFKKAHVIYCKITDYVTQSHVSSMFTRDLLYLNYVFSHKWL